MHCAEIVAAVKKAVPDPGAISVSQDHPDELCVKVMPDGFRPACIALHNALRSPVMALFASDRRPSAGTFEIRVIFLDFRKGPWVAVCMDVGEGRASFGSLARDIYSASLFEREIREMFGIEPEGNPDTRRLRLHDEVCPPGNYPLRKDFARLAGAAHGTYAFNRVEGEGVFEVPVGPVHAGIIGPGHFRFSVAGEPIVNLEPRLGFTHRGVEKLFEGLAYPEAVALSERVSGDSVVAHSTACAMALEKIYATPAPAGASIARAIFLELERIYNHVNDIGGMAVDVGFSFPAAYASIMKEAALRLNEKISGSRYLRKVNAVGGLLRGVGRYEKRLIFEFVGKMERDLDGLERMLLSSVSFMDRVETTGVLRRKTAEDLGVVGLAARASGIPADLRRTFPGVYGGVKFMIATEESGDVLARLRVRLAECRESCRLITEFAGRLDGGPRVHVRRECRGGAALGYAEGWRGPVLYWIRTDANGRIERCKIVDPSFHNWQGLSYAVLGDIVPDFPLCNKSFDLSYSGNDL